MPRLNVTSELRGVSIDRSSPVPLYFQLAQHLEAEIRSGSLPVGTRLENEVALARELGLSRPTVRAAFGYLAERGMVARKRGYGTVVTREKLNRDVQLTSLHDDLIRAGQQPATKVLRNEVAVASESVAAALELPEGSLVICLERIRFADGEPIALMHNFLPAALVRLNDEALETHGLYEILRAAGIALTSATQRMSARNALAAEARLLDEPRGAALLTMERTVLDDRDRPVEFGQHVYRASRYSLRTSLRMS
jgi:DNA-binding GntR family transcriptional regulator